jgi:iron complex outermembrane receptor protein/vitamin B12 transporter
MKTVHFLHRFSARILAGALAAFTVVLLPALCNAASIRGAVSDPTGARVTGATISLVSNGQSVGTTISTADGSFQITTGESGHFFLVISAPNFRQLQTPDFYAGSFDSVERNLVLEPAWVREAIVVTATGIPTPQEQTSEATSVLEASDLQPRDNLVAALKLMPGTAVSQIGQMGAQASLFVRGGNSSANKVLLDGVDAGDLGGYFDFGALSTDGIESVEVFRGANSSLYGSDAGSSVINLRTPHGTTSFPSVLARFEGGNLNTTRDEATVAGVFKRLDYLAGLNWLQTSNDLPNDEFHSAAWTGNLGGQLTSSTQVRGTVHYGVSAVGDPNAWDFYHIADNTTQKDQDLFVSGAIDNQTTAAFHNVLRYGATRKREQWTQWALEGNFDAYGNGMGQLVTVTGANGYSVTGQALLDSVYNTYPSGFAEINNRDQVAYQGDYHFTAHLYGLLGYHYADERGVYNDPTYATHLAVKRTDASYNAAVHGDYRNRFFYTLSGSLEHNSLFGTDTTPRAGVSYYLFKPKDGVFSGTRLQFNYGDGVREPTLDDETYSLYRLMASANQSALARQIGISPLTAPATRSYDGGLTQSFLQERLVFRLNLFHNQFGHEIESVPSKQLVAMMTSLTSAEIKNLKSVLGSYYTNNSGLVMNTQAFRAQGIETTVEGGIGSRIFLRGGYTYTDAVVQRSFTSDNETLLGVSPTMYNGSIPVGIGSPLVGARPFRRPPHTGFFTATYTAKKLTGYFTSSFSSRSDDATYLTDANYSPYMYLPNRNLDHGYAKLDMGGSYQVMRWLDAYTQMENLLNNQHMAPIGYPSLPYSVRTGLRIHWGLGSGH